MYSDWSVRYGQSFQTFGIAPVFIQEYYIDII